MIASINFGLNPVLTKENLFGDNIAKIEAYDFSTANLSDEHRLHAITSIASICYNNPKAINSQSLYDRLYRESKGLPSSSFEFIKMLIPVNLIIEKIIGENNKNLLEYGNVNRCLKDHEYFRDFSLNNFSKLFFIFNLLCKSIISYFTKNLK